MPRGVYQRTEEGRKNLSIAQRGCKKPKVSAALRGRKLTPKHIQAVKEGIRKRAERLGYYDTPETKLKKSIANRGPKNHFWKGGKSELLKRVRATQNYKEWRSNIFTRDDWTCLACGTRGVPIQAHHINSLGILLDEYHVLSLDQALATKELFDETNGQTLCIPCHKKTDNYALNKQYQMKKE